MYSKREEFWNTITHAIGIPLGIIGLILLVSYDTHKTSWSTLSLVIYALSIILLYTSSTIYHGITDLTKKPLLRKWDHISIYFLIAGTYTPLALISLEHANGWILFWTVWGITAFGTLLKVFFTGKYEVVSLILYLVMGWLVVFDYQNVVALHSAQGLTFLILGGVAYTLGTVFYVVQKIPFNHAIWHLFVLAGSVFHFLFILTDVI